MLSNFEVKSQDYGTVNWYQTLSAKNNDGFRPPLSRKEEKIRRKAKRLSLTHKDLQALNLHDRGKELTFRQKIRYFFANRKQEKLDKLQDEAKNQIPSSPATGYDNSKYALTIEEQEIVRKSEQDSIELTVAEKKILKKARKKQKKNEKQEEKFNKQYSKDDLSAKELELLAKEKSFPDSLSKEEKKHLRLINKKNRRNNRIDDKIYAQQLDSAYASGGYMPIPEKKFRLPKISLKRKGPKPSNFLKKLRRTERKLTPTLNQKQAMGKARSGAYLTSIEKYRAKRGQIKEWRLEQKMERIYHREFMKNQTKSTRKKLRKSARKANNNQKSRKKYLRKTKFNNFFKKKKR